MLYLLFIVTSLFFIVLGILITGRKFNPLTFFMGFWGVWLVISLSNPFLLNGVSVKAYLLLWVNIVCFSVGFLLLHKKNSSKSNESEAMSKLKGYESVINNKKFLAIQIFVFLTLLYFYQKYQALLSMLTAEESRRIVFELGLLFSSSFEYYLFTWIITPVVFTSVVLMISNLVVNGRKSLSLFISLANCLLFGFIGSGRLVYFQVIIFAVVALAFKSEYTKIFINKIKFRTKFLVTVVLTAAVYAMNLSGAKRIGLTSPSFTEHMDVFVNVSLKQFVIYFTGPFRAFDHFLATNSNAQIEHTLGRSFLGGIEEIINVPFAFMGKSWTTANVDTARFTLEDIYIGQGETFNAFYTSVMNFYMDGGIPFVVIMSLIFGLLSSVAYNYYLKNPNMFTFSLIIFLTYHMIASEFRWSFSNPSNWLVVFLLLWLNYQYSRKSANYKVDTVTEYARRDLTRYKGMIKQ